MWVSMRLRSICSVDALIGRRLRPRIRPASACSRYQSQTSLTDMPARAAWRSADGSSPFADGRQLLARQVARRLGSQRPILAKHQSPRPALGVSVLDRERSSHPRASPGRRKPLNSLSQANTS